MKKLYLILLSVLAVLSSCTELKEMRQDIDELDGRVSKLEELCKEMNTNISSLQTIVTALQENDYVTKVTPIDKAGKVIGYTINFTKSDPVTIFHGEKGDKGDTGHSPKVGVKKDTDGIYYWTLDEDWLLNQDGKKVKAEGIDGKDGENGQDGQDGKPGTDGTNGKDGQNGLTPELKIQEGYWYVRYGNEEWRKLGPATGQEGKPGTDGTDGKDGQDGDSFFKDVKVTADNVVFTLSNGETFNLPFFKGSKLSITFDDSEIGILPGKTASVAYTVQGGSDKTVVKALGQNGWSAKVVKESSTNGKIIVTSPDPLIEDEIIVLVYDGERSIMSTINFVTGVITPSAEAVNAAIEGGQYEVTVNTNLDYTVCIPESDKSWISLAPQTKSMRTDKLTFVIAENTGSLRTSSISLQNSSGDSMQNIKVIQQGVISRLPASNQIYYTTTDKQTLSLRPEFSSAMGANVLSNVYTASGIGIITFDKDVVQVGDFAFDGCTNIYKIVIPEKVTSIGQYAFSSCSSLNEIYLISEVVLTGNANMLNEKIERLIVPKVSYEQYKVADFWSSYADKFYAYDYSLEKPDIVINQKQHKVSHVTGDSMNYYTIIDPSLKDNPTVTLTSNVSWINNLNGVNGKIHFSFDENTSEIERDGLITVSYSNADPVDIAVHQVGKVRPSMVISVRGVKIPLVKVDGGSFTMGAAPGRDESDENNEIPWHQVTLSDCYIGQYEVTQELWEAVMGSNPSHSKGLHNPAESVSWNDIVNDFLPKLNALTGKTFTLPTEAQWEFAARGGNKSKGYKYSGSDNIDEVAWYFNMSSLSYIHPVGQKFPNELGVYDMSGNVYEWCSDWYGDYSVEAQTDPIGPTLGNNRVFRGGVYRNTKCSLSGRNYFLPDNKDRTIGFRLVLSDVVSLNKKSLKLIEGQSETLKAMINGIFVGNSGLTWKSSNSSVANVDAEGRVKANGMGSAVLTAIVNNTGKEVSCNVEVVDGLNITTKGISIRLIKVDGGTFTMGATPEQGSDVRYNEKPIHQVTLSDYYIAQCLVTKELWEAVMGPKQYPSWYNGNLNPENPIQFVSWNDIVNDFLPKLNALTGKTFTLPTEAQWEFAARGGNKTQGYKYSGSNDLDEVAWYNGNNSPSGTKPVSQKLPNELGLYDMSGNVGEWCSDWYGDYSVEAQTDPIGPISGSKRIMRGGGYNHIDGCRVSYREESDPAYGTDLNGFRLVLTL